MEQPPVANLYQQPIQSVDYPQWPRNSLLMPTMPAQFLISDLSIESYSLWLAFFHWKFFKKNWIYTQPTEFEVHAFYIVTKRADYLCQVLELIGIEFLRLIHVLEDRQQKINIIQYHCYTYQVKHIIVTISTSINSLIKI